MYTYYGDGRIEKEIPAVDGDGKPVFKDDLPVFLRLTYKPGQSISEAGVPLSDLDQQLRDRAMKAKAAADAKTPRDG
jgi:hypothetical protein